MTPHRDEVIAGEDRGRRLGLADQLLLTAHSVLVPGRGGDQHGAAVPGTGQAG